MPDRLDPVEEAKRIRKRIADIESKIDMYDRMGGNPYGEIKKLEEQLAVFPKEVQREANRQLTKGKSKPEGQSKSQPQTLPQPANKKLLDEVVELINKIHNSELHHDRFGSGENTEAKRLREQLAKYPSSTQSIAEFVARQNRSKE